MQAFALGCQIRSRKSKQSKAIRGGRLEQGLQLQTLGLALKDFAQDSDKDFVDSNDGTRLSSGQLPYIS